MNTVAVVLASGSGERFGKSNTPKHLTPFLGVRASYGRLILS